LLNANNIKKYLSKKNCNRIEELKIFQQIDSTNTYLVELAQQLPLAQRNKIYLCLAEQQTAGKGRLGRKWISPFAANIYLSVLWPFAKNNNLAGLSLVVATIIADVLTELGVQDVGLKWPNDVLWQSRKLSGILIEMLKEVDGIVNAIIGIGLNVDMPATAGELINKPWVDMREITGKHFDRNEVVALLINHLINKLTLFQQQGITMFIERWRQLDVLIDTPAQVVTTSNKISGIVRGIDDNGYLRLEDAVGKIHLFATGEVLIRTQVSH
jgi:BirA family biotin operon repressor/biotin-[acetyl-CoA-carboxylase] ligase